MTFMVTERPSEAAAGGVNGPGYLCRRALMYWQNVEDAQTPATVVRLRQAGPALMGLAPDQRLARQ
jgi:hypothetical protein